MRLMVSLCEEFSFSSRTRVRTHLCCDSLFREGNRARPRLRGCPCLARCHTFYRTYDLDGDALNRASEAAWRAVSLDDKSARCHVVAGYCALYRGEFEDAEFHHARAASLNPNDAHVAMHMGAFLVYAGRAIESERWFSIGRLLNPLPPVWYSQLERLATYALGRYAGAAIAAQGTADDVLDLMYVAASLGQLGHRAEAGASLARCQSLKTPEISLHACAKSEPYRSRSGVEQLLEGLYKAGLPE